MASIREHRWVDGRTRTWAVLARVDGRQTSHAFTTRHAADTFRRQVDALGWHRALAELDRATRTTPTLDALAADHIAHLTGITDGTRTGYTRLWSRTWAPLIGSRPVDSVTREHLADAVNTLSRRLSPKSVRNAWGLLSAVLTTAERRHLVTEHPGRGMRLPADSHDRREMLCLSRGQARVLLDEIDDHHRPLVLTLLGTGIRWGEACALRVGDVDLDRGELRVVRALKESQGRREIGPPKSRAGRRTVTLPVEVVDVLRPLVEGRAGDGLVFTGLRGLMLHHRHFWQRVWRPAVDRAQARGLGVRPRIHDLRHTHASWLLGQGVPLPVVQSRLGHEDIRTTVGTYGHLLPDVQRQAAAAASAALAGMDVPRIGP